MNFSTISAGKKYPSYRTSTLKFLPSTCFLSDLDIAINEAKKSYNTEPIIVVVMHEDDFEEVAKKKGIINLDNFNQLLHNLAKLDDICLLSISQAVKKTLRLDVKQFQLFKKIRNISNLLPEYIPKPEMDSKLIPYHNQVNTLWLKVTLHQLLRTSLIPSIVTFYIIKYLSYNYSNLIVVIFFGILLSIVALSLYVVKYNKIYKIWIKIIFYMVGISIGILLGH